jgi:SAM-dependent methyltransferase
MGTRKTALTPLANSADEGSSTDLLYQLHARDYFAATVMADMSATYGRFLTELAPGSRILDAGCGSGRDLKHFLSKGFKPTGIDAASALVALAAEFSEAPCFVMRIEDSPFVHCFEGVWACASLLHVPKSMLGRLLTKLERALVPGGTLFASVRLGVGESVAPDGRHFSLYGPDEFAKAVTASGFEVTGVWTSNDLLPKRIAVQWVNVLAKSCGRTGASQAVDSRGAMT